MVNNTVIDWFMPWPEQALYAVANSFLGENQMVPEEHADQVSSYFYSQDCRFKTVGDRMIWPDDIHIIRRKVLMHL